MFVADWRSPIARSWIGLTAGLGHEIMVISTYPTAAPPPPGDRMRIVDITRASIWDRQSRTDGSSRQAANRSLTQAIKNAPLTRRAAFVTKELIMRTSLNQHSRAIQNIGAEFKPDLVHALRIPFEGIVTTRALATDSIPFVISIWGNDLTLVAPQSPSLTRSTTAVLQRADALITDCERDIHLAVRWGFPKEKPWAILPTSGGLDTNIFHPGPPLQSLAAEHGITPSSMVVVNPRGYRNYVCQDAFIRAIPAVVERLPNVAVIAIGLRDFPAISRLVDRLGLKSVVRLLPALTQREVGDILRLATVSVSPSLHDGTPNSLLESMATGCTPVAGDIESIREWITDGANGLLCDPTDPASQATAMIRALTDRGLQKRARDHNLKMVESRAERGQVMKSAQAIYSQAVARSAG